MKQTTLKLSTPSHDPSYYDSSGFKGEGEGIRDPPNQRTFLHFFGWGPLKRLENVPNEALLKEAAEKHDAAVAKERKYNRVIDRFATSAVTEPKGDVQTSDDFIPALPVISNAGGSHGGNNCHRDKLQDQSEIMCFHFCIALVARPVGQEEINNTPAAQAALDKEWNKILQVRVHGTILPLGNGMMFRGKPSRTKPKFMLVRSSRFVLKREVSSRWVTPCASLRVARVSGKQRQGRGG